MDKELKDKWVKALRSGYYKQTTGILCRGGSHCCLGVLCELLKMKRYPIKEPRDDDTYSYSSDGRDTTECIGELSGAVLARIELDVKNMSRLIHMNDVEGKSFGEIADYIEENL